MPLLKNFPKTFLTLKRHSRVGWVGDGIPLPIDKPVKFYTIVLVGWTIGIGTPFFTLRYQILKSMGK